MNTKPVILIGNGGHANVLVNILQMNNIDVIGCVSPKFVEDFPIPYLGTDDFIFKNYMPKETFLINGIGSVGDMGNRKNAYLYYKRYGYTFLSLSYFTSELYSWGRGAVDGRGCDTTECIYWRKYINQYFC